MLRPGHVYIAPGGTRHLEVSGKREPACLLVDGPPVSGHSPSVDRLFTTGAVLGERVVGVLLTGMGRDGADGLKTIREQGGYTIAQSEATCVVYGMPRVAAEIGAVKIQLPLNMIAAEALKAAGEWITA
jgi:two-component system chemotaxis response regulator CheB